MNREKYDKNIFNYKCGSFDISDYPIIKAKINPSKNSSKDIKEYLDALVRIIQKTSGDFVIYIDATESKWLNKEGRDTTYVGMKYIQYEYKNRYKAHYIVTHSILIKLLVRLIYGFSKKGIIQKVFSKEQNAILEIEEDMKKW